MNLAIFDLDGTLVASVEIDAACYLARVGSMLTLFFHRQEIRGWQQASACETDRFARFFWGMMDRGIYLPCSQYEAMFVSAAHTTDDIDATIAAAKEVLSASCA